MSRATRDRRRIAGTTSIVPTTAPTPVSSVPIGATGAPARVPLVPAQIERLSYSILTLEDLIASRAPRIENSEYIIGPGLDNLVGSLSDPYMGRSALCDRCLTCGLSQAECPGHIGYIPFPPGFYLPNPFTGRLVAVLLQIVCQHCGTALFRDEDILGLHLERYAMPARINMLASMTRVGRMCPAVGLDGKGPTPDCGVVPNYEIKFTPKELLFSAKLKRGTETISVPLDNVHIFNALSGIDRKTVITLGFLKYHPRDLMMRFFPVIPPSMREVTGRGFGFFARDHMGSELRGVMRDLATIKRITSPVTAGLSGASTSVRIRTRPGRGAASAPPKSKSKAAVAGIAIMDPSISSPLNSLVNRTLRLFGMRAKKGKKSKKDDLRGYNQLLGGKKGHMRHKIQGKRVDLTARTPAVPDPSIAPDEIGVPLAMVWPASANTLFCRVPITDFNIDHLRTMLEEGQITRYFYRRKGNNEEFTVVPDKELRLIPGDEVGTTFLDGADMLFNRNPGIHRLSLQGVRVRVVKGKALRINPSIVTEFNMDFDGDEGNMGIISRYTSRAEVRYVASTVANPVNPEFSGASHGIIQDNVSAAYMMTNAHDVPWKPTRVQYIIGIIKEPSVATLKTRLAHFGLTTNSPRGLLSATLPATFAYRKGKVQISRGVIVTGTVDKSHIGAGVRGTIGHYLAHFDYIYGPRRVMDFLSDFSMVTGEWLSVQRGMSVSHDDTHVGDARVEEMRSQVYADVRTTVRTIHEHFTPIDAVDKHRQEQEIVAVVNRGEAMGTKVTDEIMEPDNSMRISIVSGARGSRFHSANITAILGQQFIMNERPHPELPGERFLTYSHFHSKDPEDHGFTVSNYGLGLDPISCFLQQASTRPLIADTSLKTADVGDLAHRVGLGLENFIVLYDGSVVDHNGRVVTFVVGAEGLNPSRLLPRAGTSFGINVLELADIVNAETEMGVPLLYAAPMV